MIWLSSNLYPSRAIYGNSPGLAISPPTIFSFVYFTPHSPTNVFNKKGFSSMGVNSTQLLLTQSGPVQMRQIKKNQMLISEIIDKSLSVAVKKSVEYER